MVVFNHKCSSNIYAYNVNTGKFSNFGGASKHTSDKWSLLDFEHSKYFDVRVTNPVFSKVVYDKYRDLYYRLHNGGTSLKDEDGNSNSYMDKKVYLTVFNSEGQVTNEIPLPSPRYGLYDYAVSREGLVLNAKLDSIHNQPDSYNLPFHIFKFSSKK